MESIFRCFNVIRKFHSKPSLFRNLTPLTKDKYPYLKRGPYGKLETSDIHFFQSILGVNYVITDAEELISYNVDWLKSVSGK